MAITRIQLFGRMAIFVDDRPLAVGPPHIKPLELCAYLLIHRQHSHPREALATLLWPELPPAHGKKNLRKVLCTLQHLLTDAVGPGDPPLLLIEHDWLALNPARELQLDVAAFEQAYALAQQYEGDLDTKTAQVIATAVALYEGELLTGLYADWCLYERERLENMYFELQHTLMAYAEHRHAYKQAIAHGLEILRHDRANERAHRDLIRLYYLIGDRSAALHQYEHCVATLATELGVGPCKCTESLYRQICRDERAMLSATPDVDDTAWQHMQRADPQTRSYLQQIHAELQRVLQQVQDEIQRVEGLLKS